jgi:adenylate kinase family enzyme
VAPLMLAAPIVRAFATPSRQSVMVSSRMHRTASVAASGATLRAGADASAGGRATDGRDAVVFVLGGPGSGKGTQCAMLQEAYGMVHLSAGELLRAEASKPSSLGAQISAILAEGQIVPSAVTVALLRQAMAAVRGPFLIDGFPRSLENLEAYEAQGGACAFILCLELSEDEMCARLLERGQTSGRSDDNLATIKKRFRTFREQTMPVLEAMRARGLLRNVPANGTPRQVFESVKPHFAALTVAPQRSA